VKRSRQSVVIDDAATHPTLSTDAYVVQQQPKSMLCTPILQQGKLVAILYLENYVAVGAFTRDRAELLSLLCTQAAISLENARLYAQEQQKSTEITQREAEYRSIFESVNEGLSICDLKTGRIVAVNPTTCQMYGYSREEWLDLTPVDFLHANSLPLFDHYLETLNAGKEFYIEGVCKRKDNSFFDVEVKAVPFLYNGKLHGLMMLRDISDRVRGEDKRRQTEAKLQEKLRLLALRSAIDSTLTQGKTLAEILQQCTQEVVKHLGVAFARIWILNEPDQVLKLQASAGLYTHLDGAHSTISVGQFKIGLIAQERCPHLTNDVLNAPRVGDKAWAKREGMVAFAGYPLMVNDRLLGVLAMFSKQPLAPSVLDTLSFIANEIALGIERQQTAHALELSEAELTLKAQALEQSIQDLKHTQLQMVQGEKMASLGNLVAGVAHEINNPIGFLNGSINNAKDYVKELLEHLKLYQQHYPNAVVPIQDNAEDIDLEYLSQDLPKLLGAMQGATDRIKGISTSLRTFSRADTDYPVNANLHDGIDSTLLILKYRLKANEHRPAIEVIQDYGDLPLIECFPGQLNQVFMNLLANAIDIFDEMAQTRSFAELEAHPQKITIRTAIVDNQVQISIHDNGLGMTKEVQAKIFDHLFTTKGVGKGTGLGLAIARQIVVEKHGGSLEVQSEVGHQTEFLIQLPLQR
jgi:PAS domain S-box-containing protein